MLEPDSRLSIVGSEECGIIRHGVLRAQRILKNASRTQMSYEKAHGLSSKHRDDEVDEECLHWPLRMAQWSHVTPNVL